MAHNDSAAGAVDPMARYYAAIPTEDVYFALGPSALLITAQDGQDLAFPWAGMG